MVGSFSVYKKYLTNSAHPTETVSKLRTRSLLMERLRSYQMNRC